VTLTILSLDQLETSRFDTPEIQRALTAAVRQLAEFKGVSVAIPNQGVLISTLSLQEARESSAIENIVITQDELFLEGAAPESSTNPAAKEVLRYGQALRIGFELVHNTRLITINHILRVQAQLEPSKPDFRKGPGTTLKDAAGRVIYTPPQSAVDVVQLMHELEQFINTDAMPSVDPLIRMALIHHQFESIHPFYDGNGRTGRIINVLYLVKEGLLDIPVLYLSRHIMRTKSTYYSLLQSVRETGDWTPWVVYMLEAVEVTAREGVQTIRRIREAMLEVKQIIRGGLRFYNQELLNHLFSHPYTRVPVVERDLGVSRPTATKYLEQLAEAGILQHRKYRRSNLYINRRLVDILTDAPPIRSAQIPGTP
jgi:Fic family protein